MGEGWKDRQGQILSLYCHLTEVVLLGKILESICKWACRIGWPGQNCRRKQEVTEGCLSGRPWDDQENCQEKCAVHPFSHPQMLAPSLNSPISPPHLHPPGPRLQGNYKEVKPNYTRRVYFVFFCSCHCQLWCN